MIKKLTKHGNSLALIIDKAVLELLKIDVDTPIEISTDGQMLTLVPIRNKTRKKKFKGALKAVNKKYNRMLKRLSE